MKKFYIVTVETPDFRMKGGWKKHYEIHSEDYPTHAGAKRALARLQKK